MQAKRVAKPEGGLLAYSGNIVVLVLILAGSIAPGCLAESIDKASPEPGHEQTKESCEEPNPWSKPIAEGPDQIFYFAEAISGKKLKPETYDLLRGVNEVTIERDKIVFRRVDKEELAFGNNTEHGGKFFSDWEKAKVNLEAKFGPGGKEFLDSIDSVHVAGPRIEVVRKGKGDTIVNLGERKLHHTFDLRGLRFRQLSMRVDKSGKHPSLKDIRGVSAVLNAPGFSFPVDVKEFSKLRLEKDNDINVGVRNPVPGAVRAILFLPGILRFHFMLPRKD